MRSSSKMTVRLRTTIAVIGVLLLSVFGSAEAFATPIPFLNQFNTIKVVSSTIPANGDVNPYGVFTIPRSVGKLVSGNVLVSNFNDKNNLQGKGTTIVQISPSGQQTLFAQLNPAQLSGACPGGVGLTTALVVLKRGWVIVGSLPTADGTSATAQAGCLIVLDSFGNPVETISGGLINGPWDATVFDQENRVELFVSNVLNGTVAASPRVVNLGTVVRLSLQVPLQNVEEQHMNPFAGHAATRPAATQHKPQQPQHKQKQNLPKVEAEAVIGTGFSERTDPAALVIGPTGLGLGLNGTLYVADTLNNRIAAIPGALFRRTTAFSGLDVTANGALNGPLGLSIAPNGDILTVNGGDGNIVETAPDGNQIAVKQLDNTPVPGSPNGAGCLFGVQVSPFRNGVYFVDDCSNTLNILTR